MDFIHTWALWPCNSIVLFHLISNPSETVHQLILQWRFSLFPYYPVTPPSCFLLAPLVCPSTSLSTQPKQKNRDLVSTTAASLYHQWNNCKGMFMLGATAWVLCPAGTSVNLTSLTSTSLSTQSKNNHRDLVSTTAASLYHQWNNCKGMFMLGATAWVLCPAGTSVNLTFH